MMMIASSRDRGISSPGAFATRRFVNRAKPLARSTKARLRENSGLERVIGE
jgi:hypothetical protein